MGIRKKAFFFFCFFLVSFIASFFFYEYHINKLVKQAKLSNFAWIMLEDILQVRRHEKNFILRGEEIFRGNRTYTDLLRSHLQRLYQEAKQYKKITSDPDEIKKVDRLIEQLRLYDIHVHTFIENYGAMDTRQETEFLITAGSELVDLVEDLRDTASTQMDTILVTLKEIQKRQGIFLIAILMAAFIAFWFMFRTMVVPVRRLHELNQEIARDGVIHEGQLHMVDELIRGMGKSGEIAELARGYREMMVRCSNSYVGLKEKMEEVEQLYKLKSEFTSTVSHELRTPLTAINEGINLVLDGSTGEINEEQKEFLGVAQRNVERLARLINHVLDFSKLTANKLEFNIEQVSLNGVIHSVLDIYRLVIEKKNLALVIDLSETEGMTMMLDPDRVNQVLTNILSNSVKFTDEGSITVRSRRPAGTNFVEVSVADTGIGVAAEDISRLFRPFSQVGKGREKTGGTGLGLAICKEIINQSGGKIWVESEPGKGSVFLFQLPVEERRARTREQEL